MPESKEKMLSTTDKFWARVNKTDSCWLWTGVISHYGYGQFAYDGICVRAHRFSYELHREKIPKGLVIDHICRVRNCVNPDHLRVVTNKENVLCGEGASARNIKATHCIHGHPLDEKNTHIAKEYRGWGSGFKRECKTCRRLRMRKYYKQQKQNGK